MSDAAVIFALMLVCFVGGCCFGRSLTRAEMRAEMRADAFNAGAGFYVVDRGTGESAWKWRPGPEWSCPSCGAAWEHNYLPGSTCPECFAVYVKESPDAAR